MFARILSFHPWPGLTLAAALFVVVPRLSPAPGTPACWLRILPRKTRAQAFVRSSATRVPPQRRRAVPPPDSATDTAASAPANPVPYLVASISVPGTLPTVSLAARPSALSTARAGGSGLLASDLTTQDTGPNLRPLANDDDANSLPSSSPIARLRDRRRSVSHGERRLRVGRLDLCPRHALYRSSRREHARAVDRARVRPRPICRRILLRRTSRST